jgi:protein-tyrosine phosphatase
VIISPADYFPQQRARLQRFEARESVDIHSHCLPGVDDGPATMDQALELCRGLAVDGITTVIATPHQLGRYDLRNTADSIDQAVRELRLHLAAARIPLAVERGGDVRVDERLVNLVAKEIVTGLGPTGQHILLELPHQSFIDLRGLIGMLRDIDRLSIVSHPERHPYLVRRPDVVIRWLEAGAALQVTAGSVVGAFGPEAEAACWHWLMQGMVHLIASDAHDILSRPPMMTTAIDRIASRLGERMARVLCIENPLRVLRGQELLDPQMPDDDSAETPPASTHRPRI